MIGSHGGRRLTALLLALLLLCTGCRLKPVDSAAGVPQPPQTGGEAPEQLLQDQNISAVLLYDPAVGDGWRERLSWLENTTLANLRLAQVEAGEALPADCHMVVADPTLLESARWDAVRRQLTDCAEDGALLVLDNCFWDAFPQEFLGISGATPMAGAPIAPTFPESSDSLSELQGVIRDFAALYAGYYNAADLLARDYGFGFTADSAVVLAEQGGQALYTLNDVGEGQVLLTNPLLPNAFSITDASLEAAQEGQAPFAGTSAGANSLFYGKLLAYTAMERHGYALEKVYGSFGGSQLAWELHYEDITAVANGSCYQFAELAEEAGQISSFTLARNLYWWFLRAESVTYLTNQSGKGFSFAMDEVENAYSSGTHVVSGDGWLNQTWVEHTISYFDDTGGYDQRAYPCLTDLDGDGRLDLLCGSSDGQLYFYAGRENNERFTVSEAQALTGADGSPLTVPGGYSAPAVLDLDGDGMTDIVSGAADGSLRWFRGLGGLTYEFAGPLTDPGSRLELGMGQVQSFPEAADMNGDGATDLIVGSAGGGLVILYGRSDGGRLIFNDRQVVSIPEELMPWAAPCAVDLNGDGDPDIAVGTFDGYVVRLIAEADGYRFDGCLDGPEQNYKGNCHLKFGNNCKPAFGDVNGDGRLDLICGQLEYGLAYPIDSEYFPYREELQAQIDWMEENNYYLGAHTLTHWYASDAYEKREFERQWAAMAYYGVDLTGTGTNQHTWHTSGLAPAQTYLNQYRQGMLWNSGSETPGSAATPQVAAENVMALPFFLQAEGEDTMLMLNASTLFYQTDAWAAISARYGVPICMYFHCDMIYKDDAQSRAAIAKVKNFMDSYDYCCVREDQLAYASAAALQTVVDARKDGGAVRLSASTAAGAEQSPLYREEYCEAVGVRVVFPTAAEAAGWVTNATVWRRVGNSLYLSLDREDTAIWQGESSGAHLRRVNLPAEIRWEGGDNTDLTVDFHEGGLMQVEVEGTVSTPSEGWTMVRTGENTLFYKFGDAEELVLHFWE